MNWIKTHKLLFGGVIVAIVAALWYGLSSNSGPEQILTNDIVETGSPTADTADRAVVESLLTLRAITLSGTIFTDQAFTSLRDFGTPITSEPVGRSNPFAPLGARSNATSSRNR